MQRLLCSFISGKDAHALHSHFPGDKVTVQLTPYDFEARSLVPSPIKSSLRNKPQGKESRLLPSSRRRGVKHESATFSEAHLPQLQSYPSQGCRAIICKDPRHKQRQG
jgi:hypothetical protein